MLDLCKTFSETIVASKWRSTSKDWKTDCVIKTGPTDKFLENKRSTFVSCPPLKIKNQVMTYRWTFGKDCLKLEKFCERATIEYNIIDYGVTMDLQKKSFIKTGESCPQNLWKLSALIENYIVEGVRLPSPEI